MTTLLSNAIYLAILAGIWALVAIEAMRAI